MKTIDRDKMLLEITDALLTNLKSRTKANTRMCDFLEGEYKGVHQALRIIEQFPAEERYTLREAAQIFIQEARSCYDNPPGPEAWTESLCGVVENKALEVD